MACADSVVRAILAGRQTQDRRPIPLGRVVARAGDIFYVRECHKSWCPEDVGRWAVRYRVDNVVLHPDVDWDEGYQMLSPYDCGLDVEPARWSPSIHMSRWAARLWLLAASVRIERVQNLSEADARAEGAPDEHATNGTARQWFAALWDSFYGRGEFAWGCNPLVRVIDFEIVSTTGVADMVPYSTEVA